MAATAGATFRDLQRDVAEALKLAVFVNPDDAGDNRARPPADRNRLDRVKRAVNGGLGLMGLEHDWNVLKRPVELVMNPDGDGPLNIDGDAARYRLPEWGSGAPQGSWVITGGTVQGGLRLATTSLDRVISAAAMYTAGGIPAMAAVVPHAFPGAERPVWELRVAPAPDAAYTMTIAFRRQAGTLVDDAERHPFGAEHDRTVFCYAMRKATETDMPEAHAQWTAEAAAALAHSRRIDGQLTPATLGQGPKTVVQTEADGGRWNLGAYGVRSMTVGGVPVIS